MGANVPLERTQLTNLSQKPTLKKSSENQVTTTGKLAVPVKSAEGSVDSSHSVDGLTWA